MDTLRIFVGWDSREDIAYQVARRSLLRHATVPVEVVPIKLPALVEAGLYTREVDPLASTEFTYSRFLVPHLAGFKGWALFVDCDFLFFGDVAKLSALYEPGSCGGLRAPRLYSERGHQNGWRAADQLSSQELVVVHAVQLRPPVYPRPDGCAGE